MRKNFHILDLLRINRTPLENHLIDGLVAGRVSRRDFLRHGSVLGLSLPFLGAVTTSVGIIGAPSRARAAGTPGGTIRVAQTVPAASLDPMGRHDVLAVMEQLRKHTTIFYSTHILEDVQRVSDTVAILNNGELVAQAPIEQLLAGNGSVVYDITLTGNTDAARSTLADQPWVSAVTVEQQNGKAMWHVSVSDAAAAETQG